MWPGATEDRLRAHVGRITELTAVQRQLLGYTSVATLLARAADAARTTCGFRRAVVLSIGDGELIAAESDALGDEASDQLRRRALAQPIPLTAGTVEAELVRRPERSAGRTRTGLASVVATALALDHHSLGVVAPDSRALALLALDRPDPAVDDLDHAAVDAFGAMLAVTLEHVVLRARVAELSHELRHLAGSAQALMAEVLEAPVSLPAGSRHRSAFLPVDAIHSGPLPQGQLRELLSEREMVISALLAEGRSNREIAEQLFLSPETVKTHVARLLRKLNASNRAEAVSRYLRLTQAPAD
ncbi:MAG TPA: response regulator transcription factor [Solirubrobacteraceae bacterium]|jgi:DNA-binding CsgD family transcriptional regulator|nr:response regulator transcription factor [Solirubrobacteraceae bacterium]